MSIFTPPTLYNLTSKKLNYANSLRDTKRPDKTKHFIRTVMLLKNEALITYEETKRLMEYEGEINCRDCG
jgi:hypothetical protein